MDKKILPSKDRAYLDSKGYAYRELNDGAQNGLIIDKFPVLPGNKFTVGESSLLIILPQGYPDVPPDMFYFSPEIKFSANNGFPDRANTVANHFQLKWQCWSRHAPANEWQIGVDGIHSYLQRVFTALKIAS